MIPEGHTIEDIKKREQIIRDFYREWKEKSISNEMLHFCPLCVEEVYQNGYSIFKFSHFYIVYICVDIMQIYEI